MIFIVLWFSLRFLIIWTWDIKFILHSMIVLKLIFYALLLDQPKELSWSVFAVAICAGLMLIFRPNELFYVIIVVSQGQVWIIFIVCSDRERAEMMLMLKSRHLLLVLLLFWMIWSSLNIKLIMFNYILTHRNKHITQYITVYIDICI